MSDNTPVKSGPVKSDVLSLVGNTPLVRLKKFFPDSGFELLAKLELLNPGGSIKDRPALAILDEALASEWIREDSVIIESSSGNMGIGLAQACRYHGLRFICVVDPKATQQNVQLLRAYGAEVDYVALPDPETGEFLQARINRVKKLLVEIPGAYWPNQYENLTNPAAHYRTTMAEIATALDGRIDFIFVATSTCGTIRGCAEYVRDHGISARVVAVDIVGSMIFGNVKSKRLIPGIGAGMRPPLCDISLIDECIHITDLDCVTGCRRLVAREAILAGGSSGGVLAAIAKVKDSLPAAAVCVAILADRGERYLDTIYSDEWVRENFGDVEHLWKEAGTTLPREAPRLCREESRGLILQGL